MAGAIAGPVLAFFVVYAATPYLIRWLESKNMCVVDVNKPGTVMVARPGGISIILGIVAAELALYALMPLSEILAVTATTVAAFTVGLVDDQKRMGGWYKPVALAACAIPIILLGAYDSDLAFPIFGEVHIPILYIVVIIMMIPITGNTINSIDVINGAASGFMVIAGAALTASLFIVQNYEVAIASLPLVFASLAFYRFHKNPSRIFPGDSGALTFGAMYGALAIVGGVEVIAAVALLPAIINSFLFLASTKRIVEYRKIKAKSTAHTEDMRIKATGEKDAPVTLVGLIVAGRPLTERQLCSAILRLAAFSAVLAVITAAMTGVWV